MACAFSGVRPPRRCSRVFVATRRVRSVACERVSSGVRLTEPAITMTLAATTPATMHGITLPTARPQARSAKASAPQVAKTASARRGAI